MRYQCRAVQSCGDSSKLTIKEECISRQSVIKYIRRVSVQIDSLKKGFDGFDKEGGTITQTTMMMILKSMGVEVNKVDMENYSSEVDEEETGKFTFNMFCQVAAKFMTEDDEEQMREELKEAFRIYDKENQGFITNEILKVNNT